MATNDSISKETLEQIEKALRGIVSHAMSIRQLVIPIEDSAAGADDVAVVSANCGAVAALANQIGYLADVCAGRIAGNVTSMFDLEYWFGISLNVLAKQKGVNHD